MTWWKRKKCATCRSVLKAKKGIHELRLNTADGLHEVEVCGRCATILDKSAEVLNAGKGKKRANSEEDG